MSWKNEHPRTVALGAALLGAAILGIIMAIGGVEMSSRAKGRILFLALGGIFLGVGLMQLVWPPKPAEADGRNAFARAPWGQKLLWIFGGSIGVVVAAVVQTVASGKY